MATETRLQPVKTTKARIYWADYEKLLAIANGNHRTMADVISEMVAYLAPWASPASSPSAREAIPDDGKGAGE